MARPGDLLTIKEFSEVAGRSKQAIYKQIGTRLASYVHEKDGKKYIERRALDEVFKVGDNQPIQLDELQKTFNVEQQLYSTMQVTIELLQNQIRVKDQQIESKDKQIEELNARLAEISSALVLAQQTAQAAQALHAGTMQMQKQLNASQDADNHLESEPKNKKHWWHLW